MKSILKKSPTKSVKTWLRHFIHAALMLWFLVSMYQAFRQLVDFKTNISIEFETKSVPIPSITFCPLSYTTSYDKQALNLTLMDYTTSDEPLALENFEMATFSRIKNARSAGSNVKNTMTDLKNPKFYEIGVSNSRDRLKKCITFNPPEKQFESGTVIVTLISKH